MSALRGLFVGGVIGVTARIWMRLISGNPEFSVGGTISIIGIFAVWGLIQGLVGGVLEVTTRRWMIRLIRLVGVVGMLPLFGGAGVIMAPTVLVGGLAVHRRQWMPWIRIIAGGVALLPVNVVAVDLHDDLGWSWRWWSGIVGLVAICSLVIALSRQIFAKR